MKDQPADPHAYDHKFHDRKPLQNVTPGTATPIVEIAPRPAPFGLSNSIYVVVRPGGERHYIEKMTPKELAEWARGLDVTIIEYHYAAIVHTPPPKPPGAKP